MATKIFDAITRTDLILTESHHIYGNLSVEGNISEYYSETLNYSVEIDSTLEIFGDLFVTGNVCLAHLIVHGNLYCTNLNCITCNVSGDIFIDNDIVDAISVSAGGNINIQGSAYIEELIESYGSIIIQKNSDAAELRAFDQITVGNYILNANKLTAGSGIQCGKEITLIEVDEETPFSISVLMGGIRSANINIGFNNAHKNGALL